MDLSTWQSQSMMSHIDLSYLIWRIHNLVHMSLLKEYKGLEPTKPLEEPLEVEELEEVLQPKALDAKWVDEDFFS